MTIVLDCNIGVSLAITKQLDIIAQINDLGVEIASCEALRDEISDVLSRPKLIKLVDPFSAKKVIKLYDLITQNYTLGNIPNIVADEKDNYLFALCSESGSSYFVTGDKLLLNEGVYGKTKIITLSILKSLIE